MTLHWLSNHPGLILWLLCEGAANCPWIRPNSVGQGVGQGIGLIIRGATMIWRALRKK